MSEPLELAVDSHHGIYCPQFFAEVYLTDLRKWSGVAVSDRDILLKGPDQDWYWEAWEAVLDNAKHRKTGFSVYQDGDVWLVDYTRADELREFFGDY